MELLRAKYEVKTKVTTELGSNWVIILIWVQGHKLAIKSLFKDK